MAVLYLDSTPGEWISYEGLTDQHMGATSTHERNIKAIWDNYARLLSRKSIWMSVLSI